MSFSSLGSKHAVGDIYPVGNKKVFLLVDPQNIVNNPTDYGSTFATIELLLQKGASVIIASSFGTLAGVTMNLSHKEREAALSAYEREAGMGYTNYFAILPPKVKIAVLRAVPNLTLHGDLYELPMTGKTTLFASLSNEQKMTALTSCLSQVEFCASSTRAFLPVLQARFPSYVIKFARDCLRAPLFQLEREQILVLENLRFYKNETCDNAEERLAMAQVLTSGVDLYVNDSFATSHLFQASSIELPRVLQHGAAGCAMDRELAFYSKYLAHSTRPMAVVVAGGNIIEKLKLIRSLIDKVDRILVAGAVAFPFIVAQNIPCGKSYYEWYKSDSESVLHFETETRATVVAAAAENKRDADRRTSRCRSVHDTVLQEPTIRRPIHPHHAYGPSSQPTSEFSSVILPSSTSDQQQHTLKQKPSFSARNVNDNANVPITNRRHTVGNSNVTTTPNVGRQVTSEFDELAESLKRSINMETNGNNFSNTNGSTNCIKTSANNTCNREAVKATLNEQELWNSEVNMGREYEEVPCSTYAREILELCALHQVELILPIDHIVVPNVNTPVKDAVLCGSSTVPSEMYVMDCGMHTINLFGRCLRNCRTVYWTGTFGWTTRGFIGGTNAFATLLGSLNVAAVVAGDNTARVLQELDITHNNLHISSGKLACLEVLEGHPLPGVNALSDITPKCIDAEVNSNTVNELLHHLPLFHGCTPHQMKLIAKKFTRRQHSRGDYLVYAGEHHTHLYLVASGGLIAQHVTDVGSGAARFIAPGQSVGMYEFISQAIATETVRVAHDDVTTFQLSYSAFVELLHNYSDLASQLVYNLSQPLRRMAAEDYASQQSLKQIVWRNACKNRVPQSFMLFTQGSGLWRDCVFDIMEILLMQCLTIHYKPYKTTWELESYEEKSQCNEFYKHFPVSSSSSPSIQHLPSLRYNNDASDNNSNSSNRLSKWLSALLTLWTAQRANIQDLSTLHIKPHSLFYQFTGLPFALLHSLTRNIIYHHIVQKWQAPFVASAVANVVAVPFRLASYGLSIKTMMFMTDVRVILDEILIALYASCAPLICFTASEAMERLIEKRTRTPLRNSLRLILSILVRVLLGLVLFPVIYKRYVAHTRNMTTNLFWDRQIFMYYELKQALSVLVRYVSYELMKLTSMA